MIYKKKKQDMLLKLITPYTGKQKHHIEPTCTYNNSVARACPPAQLRLGEPGTPSSSSSVSSPVATGLKLTKYGTGFKNPTHWTFALNGVTEGSGQEAPLGTNQSETAFEDGTSSFDQNVLLFEGCKQVSDQELLDSIPLRRESDSLVAFYFRALGYRSILHPMEFLKRYNAFWENPSATSVSWLGLLYSVLCLSCQVQIHQSSGHTRAQNNGLPIQSPAAVSAVLGYREKVVQCLVRAQFAKGGPDIMETLFHYILIESYLNRDPNIAVWLLMGNIVQIAIRMGYHRDPQHFKSLSPYQGEMRRRMWAMVYSLDIGFSTQMGLPSSIKHSLTDTMPPRNLQDHDFNANSVELPPGRPIDELTASTVTIAKLHVAISMGIVSDMVCNPHPISYNDLVATMAKLDAMDATIPEPCRFRPMSQCLLDPPSVVSQRISFYMHYQRARILVNWKFLDNCKDTTRANQCWNTILEAAVEILRLHHLMAEESELLDTFRPAGMLESCFLNNGYFLAASIMCFLVHRHADILSSQKLSEVRDLLERSLLIWTGINDLSREANKVVTALRIVLGNPEESNTNIITTLPNTDADPFEGWQLAFSNLAPFF
ncbi:fungal-specific transcription factor domain-containing protein, partial [Xylariales sp. PMI_506]